MEVRTNHGSRGLLEKEGGPARPDGRQGNEKRLNALLWAHVELLSSPEGGGGGGGEDAGGDSCEAARRERSALAQEASDLISTAGC
jgi:hypothetical protein